MQGIVKNEQQLIRLLISNPEKLCDVDVKYFITDIGKNLFYTLKDLCENKLEISKNHIVSFGNKRDDSINSERIDNLFNVDYSKDAFSQYYSRLKKDYSQHILQKRYLPDLIEALSSKGDFNVDRIKEISSDIDKNLFELENKKDILVTPAQMLEFYIGILHKRNSGGFTFPSGDSYLDRYLLAGFAPPWITTLFGATGIGKSIYALHLVNGQINRQIPSMLISLEMDQISTMDRLIAQRNRLPIELFYPNKKQNELIAPYILERVEMERNNLSRAKYFLFTEETSLGLADIRKLGREGKKRMKSSYIVMTIDLFSMIKEFSRNGNGNKADQIAAGMDDVQAMCKEENFHIVAVLQANRETDKVKIKKFEDIKKFKPSIPSIKSSGAFGERSRLVLSVFRAKYYADQYFKDFPETALMTDIMEVDILKQNMQKLGHLEYLYDGSMARVCRLEKSIPVKETC